MFSPKNKNCISNKQCIVAVVGVVAEFRVPQGILGGDLDRRKLDLWRSPRSFAAETLCGVCLFGSDQADQRDLQALTRALERRFGQRVFSDQSRQLLASHRRKEEESLGVYAADVQLLTLTRLPANPHGCTGGPALDQAEQGLRWSCAPVAVLHPWTRLGTPSPSAQRTCGVQSRQLKDRVRTATIPATETAEAAHALWLHNRADLEPQQCRQLGLVKDCGWTGQCATHPRPSRRRGRRKGQTSEGGGGRDPRTALQSPPTVEPGGGPDGGGPRPHPQDFCGLLKAGVPTKEEGYAATGPPLEGAKAAP
ncbi:unnamed protein product [Boreogadus saida]